MKLIDVDKLKEVLHNDKQLSSYNGIPKEVYDQLINILDANSVEVEEIKDKCSPYAILTINQMLNEINTASIYIAKKKEGI